MRTRFLLLLSMILPSVSVASAQVGYEEPFTATYAFTTDGPTNCGSNENPEPVLVTDYPPDAGLEAYPVERAATLGCDDEVDDAYGTTGFGASYDDARRLTFGVACFCILIHYIESADLDLTLWRSADGPTTVRLLRNDGPGNTPDDTLEVDVQETPTPITWPSSGPGFEGAYFLLEAAGGAPGGALYVDDIVIGGIIVPVELTHFDAVTDGRDVTLQWGTASETNNAGFEVQTRRDAGAAWTPLGFVAGHGTTTETHAYHFTATDLVPGLYAFRLKQVDFDGRFSYSDEVEVAVGVPAERPDGYFLTDVYPNPFNPEAHFELAVARSQHVRIALYDALGRRVETVYEGAVDGGGIRTFTLDGARLATGAYTLRIAGETFAASRSVVLLR